MYGILTILYILEYFEYNENYEECGKIITAIKEQEEILGITLFTKITNDNIKQVIDAYKTFNLTGENVIENSKLCSRLLIKDIEVKY